MWASPFFPPWKSIKTTEYPHFSPHPPFFQKSGFTAQNPCHWATPVFRVELWAITFISVGLIDYLLWSVFLLSLLHNSGQLYLLRLPFTGQRFYKMIPARRNINPSPWLLASLWWDTNVLFIWWQEKPSTVHSRHWDGCSIAVASSTLFWLCTLWGQSRPLTLFLGCHSAATKPFKTTW